MVLSGNVWFFKVILKPEILLQFIYILAKKSPKPSTTSMIYGVLQEDCQNWFIEFHSINIAFHGS